MVQHPPSFVCSFWLSASLCKRSIYFINVGRAHEPADQVSSFALVALDASALIPTGGVRKPPYEAFINESPTWLRKTGKRIS